MRTRGRGIQDRIIAILTGMVLGPFLIYAIAVIYNVAREATPGKNYFVPDPVSLVSILLTFSTIAGIIGLFLKIAEG